MLTRKEFLRNALALTATTLGVKILAACSSDMGGGTSGGDNTGGTTQPSCIDNGTRATIATNHGHTLVVSKEDVVEATEKAYDIRGSADHSHTVTVTVQQFADLAENQAIMIESSVDASASFGRHGHAVMVACV